MYVPKYLMFRERTLHFCGTRKSARQPGQNISGAIRVIKVDGMHRQCCEQYEIV